MGRWLGKERISAEPRNKVGKKVQAVGSKQDADTSLDPEKSAQCHRKQRAERADPQPHQVLSLFVRENKTIFGWAVKGKSRGLSNTFTAYPSQNICCVLVLSSQGWQKKENLNEISVWGVVFSIRYCTSFVTQNDIHLAGRQTNPFNQTSQMQWLYIFHLFACHVYQNFSSPSNLSPHYRPQEEEFVNPHITQKEVPEGISILPVIYCNKSRSGSWESLPSSPFKVSTTLPL